MRDAGSKRFLSVTPGVAARSGKRYPPGKAASASSTPSASTQVT